MNTNPISPWGEPNSLSRRARAATQPNPACEPICEAPPARSGGRPSSPYRGGCGAHQERLRERLQAWLHYNADTGVFTWRVNRRGRAKAGTVAGCSSHHAGYILICFNGTSYQAHRLAWLYVFGRWPTALLDHRNGIRDDNRIANLRECTQLENQQNRAPQKQKRSGLPMGVSPFRGKYRAQISLSGKVRYLGTFDTRELAHAAYLAAKAKLHTFNPVPRPS